MADEETQEETAPEEEAPTKKTRKPNAKQLKKLAEQVLDGDFGSGRDRDLRLRAAGHDPDLVGAAAIKLRGERAREAEYDGSGDYFPGRLFPSRRS
jgi:hypothetical protein